MKAVPPGPHGVGFYGVSYGKENPFRYRDVLLGMRRPH